MSSGELYWKKQLFISETIFIEKGCCLSIEQCSLLFGTKKSFKQRSVCKNVVLSACCCWIDRISLLVMEQCFHLVATFNMETSTWTLSFATPKYSHNTQYYTMPLKQLGHIMVNNPTYCYIINRGPNSYWLGRGWSVVCLHVKLFQCFFPIRQLLKQYVLPCTGYWACRQKQF